LTDDQVEKLAVGDRIKLGALTGTIVQAVGMFVGERYSQPFERLPKNEAKLNPFDI
jgi:hypothetical protein